LLEAKSSVVSDDSSASQIHRRSPEFDLKISINRLRVERTKRDRLAVNRVVPGSPNLPQPWSEPAKGEGTAKNRVAAV
jgi:hypothetical protein